MTDTEIRIAIAEACGQKWVSHPAEWCGEKPTQWLKPQYWTCNGQKRPMLEVPDYPNDLNAMHEAEKVLTDDQHDTYWCLLRRIVYAGLDEMQHCFNTVHATARQRAEAFLRTVGKWKE